MASFSDLAQEYFIRIKDSNTPVLEFEKILQEINGLIYTSSKQKITDEDKAKIVSQIIDKLEKHYSEYSSFSGTEPIFEQTRIVKAFSNDNYLDLIEYIKARTKK